METRKPETMGGDSIREAQQFKKEDHYEAQGCLEHSIIIKDTHSSNTFRGWITHQAGIALMSHAKMPWNFRLCGTSRVETIHDRPHTANDLYAQVYDLFHGEEDVEILTHAADAPCKILHSLSEVFEKNAVNDCWQLHFQRSAPQGKDVLSARLSFKTSKDSELEIGSTWTDRYVTLAIDDTIAGVKSYVQKQISEKLKLERIGDQKDTLLQDLVEIRFATVVNPLTGLNWSIDLESDHPTIARLTTLQDLFLHPDYLRGKGINLTIWIEARRLGRDQDDVIRPMRSPPSTRYIRIGESRESTFADDEDVPVEYAALAELDTVEKKIIRFIDAEAWNFGEYCIEDIGTSGQTKTLADIRSERWSLHRDFQGLKSVAELEDRIFSTPGLIQLHQRIPKLPPLTLSTFEPQDVNPPLGVSLSPTDTFVIVVKFIHHLQTPARFDFNSNKQLVLDGNDTLKTISEEALNAPDFPQELLEGEFKNKWRVEWWVLPQADGSDRYNAVMYRLKAEMKVADFLSQERYDGGERNMYAECHIWPRYEEMVQGL